MVVFIYSMRRTVSLMNVEMRSVINAAIHLGVSLIVILNILAMFGSI